MCVCVCKDKLSTVVYIKFQTVYKLILNFYDRVFTLFIVRLSYSNRAASVVTASAAAAAAAAAAASYPSSFNVDET